MPNFSPGVSGPTAPQTQDPLKKTNNDEKTGVFGAKKTSKPKLT